VAEFPFGLGQHDDDDDDVSSGDTPPQILSRVSARHASEIRCIRFKTPIPPPHTVLFNTDVRFPALRELDIRVCTAGWTLPLAAEQLNAFMRQFILAVAPTLRSLSLECPVGTAMSADTFAGLIPALGSLHEIDIHLVPWAGGVFFGRTQGREQDTTMLRALVGEHCTSLKKDANIICHSPNPTFRERL
jgi:hypothetical protein